MEVNLTPEMLVLVPVVAALLQVLKNIEAIQAIKEWLPYVAVGIALGLGYLTKMENPILPSILIGLMASGGYDLVKGPKIVAKK